MSEIMTLLGNADSTNDLYTELIRENLDRRILVINDEITESIVEDYVLYILKWNREDKNLPIENRETITLLINSPGGNVFDGDNLMDVIIASKTPIRAVCLGMAASMAFRFFIVCHERIAFKNSVLLMHDGSIEVSSSGSKAKDTMQFFDTMDERVKQYTLDYTNIDSETYDEHYSKEWYLYSEDAKKYGCVDKIIGIDVDLDYLL